MRSLEQPQHSLRQLLPCGCTSCRENAGRDLRRQVSARDGCVPVGAGRVQRQLLIRQSQQALPYANNFRGFFGWEGLRPPRTRRTRLRASADLQQPLPTRNGTPPRRCCATRGRKPAAAVGRCLACSVLFFGHARRRQASPAEAGQSLRRAALGHLTNGRCARRECPAELHLSGGGGVGFGVEVGPVRGQNSARPAKLRPIRQNPAQFAKPHHRAKPKPCVAKPTPPTTASTLRVSNRHIPNKNKPLHQNKTTKKSPKGNDDRPPPR